MKKILSILLAVAICLSVYSIAVFAADEAIVVEAQASKSELQKGDTFTVDFQLTANDGFQTLGIRVAYDADVLEVVCSKHSDGKNCTGTRNPVKNQLSMSPDGATNNGTNSKTHDFNPYIMQWAFGIADEDVVDNELLGTLTFKVKDTAAAGRTTITVTVDQASSIENGCYSAAELKGVDAEVTVAAPACTSHTYGDYLEIKPAKCGETGEEIATCFLCGDEYVREIPALEHAYGAYVETKPAKCEEPGEKTATCSLCGEEDAREIPATGHAYDNDCDEDCNSCGNIRTGHKYTSDCDKDCNICGVFRRAPHKYDNACDDTCDLCGTERDVNDHIYSNACDKTCNECGDVRTVPNHVYDNACDETCNICNAIRYVPAHVYSNVCDIDCNICGFVRAARMHVYTNSCDEFCNECGMKRTITHTYAKVCSTICSVCGETRVVKNHTYANPCDIDCNVCGFVRTVEHTFTNECDGECDICYDTRKTPHKYDGVCDSECNLCGKKRSAPDHSYGDDLTCDECGYKNYILGDIDGDTKVNINDSITLAQVVGGWKNIEYNIYATDVNGDGMVDLLDVTYLARYLAGWKNIVLN